MSIRLANMVLRAFVAFTMLLRLASADASGDVAGTCQEGSALLQHGTQVSVRQPEEASQSQLSLSALDSCDEYDLRLTGALESIEKATLEELKDMHYVANLIRQVGLVEDFRPLYGNESVNQLHVYGNRTLAEGVGSAGMYQLPMQMACALRSLSELNITTFMEVGIYTGWTGVFMTAYLSRFQPELRSIGVDITDYQSDCVKQAMIALKREYVEVSTDPAEGTPQLLAAADSLREGELIDLCFIDGDHSYDGVHHDVQALHSSCKYMMLHDVIDRDCPGVRQQWQELIAENDTHVVANCFQQPADLSGKYAKTFSLGIGIARVA